MPEFVLIAIIVIFVVAVIARLFGVGSRTPGHAFDRQLRRNDDNRGFYWNRHDGAPSGNQINGGSCDHNNGTSSGDGGSCGGGNGGD